MQIGNRLAAAVLLAAPSLALAQEHGAGDHAAGAHAPTPGVLPSVGEGIAPMVISIVVFLIVFAVLAKTAWPKISKGLEDRADKIRTEIESAEMAQKQAKAALEQYEKNLADARAEAKKMIADAVAQQQALAAENKAKAEAEINQMRERARRDIESAKRAAIEEVYASAVSQATSMASKILRREVTASDQQRLLEETLAELQTISRN
jgi:F-type H+-transporting ATPase subunit b